MKKIIITIFAVVIVIVFLFTLVLIFSHREAIAPTNLEPVASDQ